MGDPPGENYHLDREDPDGHYNKINCRWLPAADNIKRRRSQIASAEEDPF
jgi:hypothetical protein